MLSDPTAQRYVIISPLYFRDKLYFDSNPRTYLKIAADTRTGKKDRETIMDICHFFDSLTVFTDRVKRLPHLMAGFEEILGRLIQVPTMKETPVSIAKPSDQATTPPNLLRRIFQVLGVNRMVIRDQFARQNNYNSIDYFNSFAEDWS